MVDSEGDVGQWPSIAFNGSEMVIAYQDVGEQDLKLATGGPGAWGSSVVDDGKLVGIVSRANLVQAVAAVNKAVIHTPGANDTAIREALTAELSKHDWWRAGVSSLTVVDGVVHYWGYYEEADEIDAARVAAENTDGVTGVEDHRSPYPLAYAAS